MEDIHQLQLNGWEEEEAMELLTRLGDDRYSKEEKLSLMGMSPGEATLDLPTTSCSGHDRARNEHKKANRRREIAEGPKNQQKKWCDCHPQVALLREALLSSSPDIAVLGPLNGCFSFYMTNLHNEVLSSSYAKTMVFGSSVTPLESAFMWLGGWRPTSALVLVYSLMGIEIENALQTVRSGRNIVPGSTASLLSTRQLSVMHMLQKHTQSAEMKISKKLAVFQMLIGDQDMLEAVILDAVSPIANDSSRFKRVTAKRISRFRRLLVQAENLRLHTLQDLLSLLTPIQAARCGVAAFEICSSMKNMGGVWPPSLPIVAILPTYAAALPPSSPSTFSDEPVLSSDASSSDHKIMNPSHIAVLSRSDKSPILVPSCSSRSSSSLPQKGSRSSSPCHSSLSTARPTPEKYEFLPQKTSFDPQLPDNRPDDAAVALQEFVFVPRAYKQKTDADALLTRDVQFDSVSFSAEFHHGKDGQVPRPRGAETKELVSNRLLILSPSSSDVTIQSCSLEPVELSFFGMQGGLPSSESERQTLNQPELQQVNVQCACEMAIQSGCVEQLSRLSLGDDQRNSAERRENWKQTKVSLRKLGIYD